MSTMSHRMNPLQNPAEGTREPAKISEQRGEMSKSYSKAIEWASKNLKADGPSEMINH